MQHEQMQPFIEKTTEKGYVLNIWQPMMKQFKTRDEEEAENDFQAFLSKMMEMERACVEEGEDRPVITLRKDLLMCEVAIKKANGGVWIYILYPHGFNGNWEIFKVERF